MTDQEELAHLLKVGNDERTRRQQLELLKAKFIADCTYSYAGGTFFLTPEFITNIRLNMMNEAYHWGDNDILIDINMRPTLIHPMSQFYKDIQSVYKKAVNEYYQAYEKWRTSRNISSLIAE